jgi:CHAD domain-containing protein
MEDPSTHSIAPAAAEPDPPAEPLAREGVLLLPSEGSGKKVQALALRQLNRFIAYEAKVLKGDNPEAIHDMRVSSRRLQQVLDLLYARPRPPELRRLRRQVRRCRRSLGEVRNCDVLLELVARSLGRKRASRREAWTAVQHFLAARRAEFFLHAMRKFGKINFAVFYLNLKSFLVHPEARNHSGNHPHGVEPASREMGADLLAALEPVWARFEQQVAESHHHPRSEVIHAARIATKRLRYLLEVFHELGVPGSAEALVWLRQLQQHLGDWHDLEVLEQMMVEMLARPEFLREHLSLAMEVEKLILRNRKQKQGLEEQYARMSRDSAEMRRLKAWVSYLLSPSSDSPPRA